MQEEDIFKNRFLSDQSRESLPQKVVLKRVSFKSSGMYRCEVTASVKSRKPQRQRGRNGDSYRYGGVQGFRMKESINRMTVVGELDG